MGKYNKKKARQLLHKLQAQQQARRRDSEDFRQLREAAYYYWKQDFVKCSEIFFPLMHRLIVEPVIGTEEYKNGERKPEISLDEQEEEPPLKGEVLTYDDLFGTEGNTDAQEAPRDPDGYLLSENPDEYLIR